MRNITKIALAAMAILSVEMAGKAATAMTVAPPAAINIAGTDSALVQKAALVCGYRGCVRVWRHRYYDYYPGRHYGWYRGRHHGWYHRW